MDSFNEKVLLEIIKTLLSIGVLLFTWILGQKIIIFWDRRKKLKEIDSELASQFQNLYAEFKTITRLWKAQIRYMSSSLKDPKEKQWELLCRATDAEGKIEAILMKLSMERQLDDDECTTLGYFRQAYQQLRENIRESKYIETSYKAPSYKLFHKLSAIVSTLISNRKNTKTVDLVIAEENLKKIMSVRSEDWVKKLKEFENASNQPNKNITADKNSKEA